MTTITKRVPSGLVPSNTKRVPSGLTASATKRVPSGLMVLTTKRVDYFDATVVGLGDRWGGSFGGGALSRHWGDTFAFVIVAEEAALDIVITKRVGSGITENSTRRVQI